MSHNLHEPGSLVTILKEKIELLKVDEDLLLKSEYASEKSLKLIESGVIIGYRAALRDIIQLWSNLDHAEKERIKIFLTDSVYLDWYDY